jgi:hypothetical protein
MLKTPRDHLAADERGLASIENKPVIGVPLRPSAPGKPFSAA